MQASSTVLQVRVKCQCFKQLHASDDGQGAMTGKDHLSYLALPHVHIDDALNQIARLHPRRLELESVLLA